QQQFGVVERRRRGPVPAWRDAVHAHEVETAASGQQLELARGEASGPEVEDLLDAVIVADGRPLVQDPGGGVEGLAGLEEPDGECSREGGERQPPPGSNGVGDPLERPTLVAAAEEAEPALAEADNGIEPRLDGELAHVLDLEADRQSLSRGGVTGERDEVVRQVDPDDVHAATCQRERMASRPATDVEHTAAGPEVEWLHQEP